MSFTQRRNIHLCLFTVISAVGFAGFCRADQPTPEQIAWVKTNAIPVKTAQAGQGFDDLMPLKELIGDARIVSLGEGTHGTREFFQMKHRLVEFLASEMGFTIFSIEANMPEAYRVNDFVLSGEGDPKKLLKGMYFWTWDTQEVLDMILWMRQFNESGKGKIEFTGFDMQTPDVAVQIVLDFLGESDPDYLKTARESYDAATSLKGKGGGGSFGVARGSFPVDMAAGKRIRYSGYIKTAGVTKQWAGLWWRVDGESGVVGFDNMQDRGPKGTTSWKRYVIELDVAADATNINFGAIHAGDGTAWFDALQIEVDGEPYVNPKLFDLDFESDQPKGFYTGGEGYLVELDSKMVHQGKQSLAMRCQDKSDDGKPTPKEAAQMCRSVVEHLEASREKYLKQAAPEGAAGSRRVEWAIQNARVVFQWMRSIAGQTSRDRCMAENIKWILDQAPAGTKIVLWAHNGHVHRYPGAMGKYLDAWYGDEMVVFGFAAHEGRYTARGDEGLGTHDLQPSEPGSVEYLCHSTGLPRFILDLRKASAESTESAWLTKLQKFRSIGAMAMEQQFHRINVSKAFDGLIYLETTAASESLRP